MGTLSQAVPPEYHISYHTDQYSQSHSLNSTSEPVV